MRHICVLALLLATGPLAVAEDNEERKPNTLTPKEIADGWILLFDGETTFGWDIDGKSKLKNGQLVLGGGAKPTKATLTTRLGDCELRFDHRQGSFGDYRFELQAADGGTESVGGSLFGVNGANVDWHICTYSLRQDDEPGSDSEGKYRATKGEKVYGGTYAGISENTLTFSNSSLATFQFDIPAGNSMTLRNIKLKPVGLKPIFNDKDLTGWKEIPGRKSRFAVIDDGELSIKDGPGDIQTAGQWDDFVLQLDIKTNGKHLNSGVFFRALPGQFWSGYESQIRNQWQGDDRTKPIDFGTGGIYGRQPARKVVASDNEWFTKTVIAHGNHMAVWINGYQVSDFTDKRPENDNARKGTKLGKGPISLQGHDPTTDLSFRNIRIAELPRKKSDD